MRNTGSFSWHCSEGRTSAMSYRVPGVFERRVGAPGRGKRGGARIIYYWHVGGDRFYMLLAYPKSERGDLTAEQVKILRHLVKEEFR